MNPRLSSSKKWTKLPNEYLDQIKQVFSEAFETQLKNAKVFAEGRLYPEEIMLRVGFAEKSSIKQNNFEVSMQYSRDPEDALQKISTCVDVAASMMNEFFETNGEMDLPYSWKEIEFEKHTVFFQYSSVNSDLEAQADALLGDDANEDLAQGDWEAQENDEDGEPPSPTMFKSTNKKKKSQLH